MTYRPISPTPVSIRYVRSRSCWRVMRSGRRAPAAAVPPSSPLPAPRTVSVTTHAGRVRLVISGRRLRRRRQVEEHAVREIDRQPGVPDARPRRADDALTSLARIEGALFAAHLAKVLEDGRLGVLQNAARSRRPLHGRLVALEPLRNLH